MSLASVPLVYSFISGRCCHMYCMHQSDPRSKHFNQNGMCDNKKKRKQWCSGMRRKELETYCFASLVCFEIIVILIKFIVSREF